MRISDWSSDVCSSDLVAVAAAEEPGVAQIQRQAGAVADLQADIRLLAAFDEIGGIARRGALDVVLPDDLRLQRNARPHGLVFDLRNVHVAPRELVRKILAVLLMRVEAQTVREIGRKGTRLHSSH